MTEALQVNRIKKRTLKNEWYFSASKNSVIYRKCLKCQNTFKTMKQYIVNIISKKQNQNRFLPEFL